METMQQVHEAWASLPLEVKAQAGALSGIYGIGGDLQSFAFVGPDGCGWSCPVVPGRVWIVMRALGPFVSYYVELHNEAGDVMSGRLSGGWFGCTVQGFAWSAEDRENWARAWAVLGFRAPFPVLAKL